MSYSLYILLAGLFGTLIPLQGAINAKLAIHLSSYLQASFISFLMGVLTLTAVLLVTQTGFPELNQLKKASFVLVSGGILGATFVTSVIFLIPQIGSVALIAATITGQLIVALIIDHFGYFSVPIHPINIKRIVGVFFLFVGIFLVQR